jgi:RHS repeat-associated protein
VRRHLTEALLSSRLRAFFVWLCSVSALIALTSQSAQAATVQNFESGVAFQFAQAHQASKARPSHGRPQRSEDGHLGGAGRAQAEGRARNRVGITNDALGNLAAAKYADGTIDLRMPDAVGNLFRTSDRSDRKYGPAGQLLESHDARGVTTYEYDPEGNLTKKIEPDGSTWHYEWNGAGMLAKVTRPNGHVVTFEYDPLARRTLKSYRGKTTRWIWDGNVPLHEWVERAPDAVDEDFSRAPREDDSLAANEKALKALLAGRPANGPPGVDEVDQKQRAAEQSGTAEAPITWLFEPESFAPLAKLVNGEQFAIVTDHLGTPSAMFDGAGREVWGAHIDAYGDLRNLRGERQACPFRWPGQYEDEESGLYYARFRYYDSRSATFVSVDPIRLWGGLRPFAYVSDPLTFIDPLGLAATYCGKSKRWRDEKGRFRSRPNDPSELVRNGHIDYPSLMEWKNGNADWNPANAGNQWSPSPTKFPTGGYSYDQRAPNGDRFRMHGHGANPSAPVPSNAASGATTTIRRVHNGQGEVLTTSGQWVNPQTANPNDVHIPLTNSPF